MRSPASATTMPADAAQAAARDAWRSAALVAAAVALVVLLPVSWVRSLGEAAVYGLGALAVARGLRRQGPAPAARIAWVAVSAALVAFAVSSVAEAVALAAPPAQLATAVETALDMAGYASLLVGGTFALARGLRHWESWVDGGTLLLAAALTTLVWLDGAGGGTGSPELAVGLPALAVVVVVAGLRIALPGGSRSTSGAAVLVAGVCALCGHGLELLAGDGVVSPAGEALELLAVASLTLAGLHPSMVRLHVEPEAADAMTTARLWGLGATLLVNPALVLLWMVRHGGGRVGYGLGVGIALLTASAMWRLGRLSVDREQARLALAASEARLRALVEHAADVIVTVDGAGRVTYISPAVESLLGRPADSYLGDRVVDHVAGDDVQYLVASLRDVDLLAATDVVDVDVRVRHQDGSSRWVAAKISSTAPALGVPGWVVNLREVTERKVLEESLRHQAAVDPLTGLANRTRLEQRVTAQLGSTERDGAPALLFVDLDDFKAVNDTWGHAAGDALLVALGQRMTSCVRDRDTVSRLGGDEFAVLLDAADAPHATRVAERILVQLGEPFPLGSDSVRSTASVGVALARPGDTFATLLARADAAMYVAKQRGKSTWALASDPEPLVTS